MAKRNRKRREQLNLVDKRSNQQKYQNYCDCTHRDSSGNFTLCKTGKKNAKGQAIWKCTDCGHDVDLSKVELDDLKTAAEMFKIACDAIKMSARPEDEVILSRAKKFQLSIPQIVADYEAVLNHNAKKRDRRDRDNGYNGGGYGGPQQSFNARR